MRCAFFKETQNIGEMSVLDTLAKGMGIPVAPLHERLDNGEAHAALQLDIDARDQYRVPGSPTLVFNDGRQRLYGNVGYRIIEANIRELLNNGSSGEASWC
ncbi:MAG: DsbA family protein [Gammaproteobacteria bacterium]|nr:DsbA family protein [Gammaproteobacteria bacterium]